MMSTLDQELVMKKRNRLLIFKKRSKIFICVQCSCPVWCYETDEQYASDVLQSFDLYTRNCRLNWVFVFGILWFTKPDQKTIKNIRTWSSNAWLIKIGHSVGCKCDSERNCFVTNSSLVLANTYKSKCDQRFTTFRETHTIAVEECGWHRTIWSIFILT